MAKAHTYEMEQGGYLFEHCKVCGEKANHRAFYYPTVFNGDAEWLGDFCERHKNVNIRTLTTPDKTTAVCNKE